ncbi:MAG: transporter substrate-binding domain-containing protein [Firmicutes bacterium]|nr:transporter substrate-binding domain-containing protein [Bacillota bacterium]
MKKLNLITCLLVFAIAFVVTVGAGYGEANAKSTIQKVLSKKELIIGTAPGYLPFEMLDKQGNFMGYDVDLGKAIAESLGVSVEFKQFPFAGIIPALQTGEIDMVIAGMTIRGDRALAVSFSNPYYATGQVLMVPAHDNTTSSWQDLNVKGKRIAISQGTTGALLAKQIFKEPTLMDFEDFPSATLALVNGMADALIYDEPAIRMYETMQEDSVRGVYDLISAENLGVAVAYGDFETVHWLNSFLYAYVNSPAEIESRDKWFHQTDWMELMN